MHELGLVPNDLNPINIVIDVNTSIMIDFDSYMPEGQKRIKGGTYRYSSAEVCLKRKNNIYWPSETNRAKHSTAP